MITRSREPGVRSQAGQVLACDFCGLPMYGTASDEPRYCCYGCRFAASITAAEGDEGQARWMMTRLGLAIFFWMSVMVFTMLLWSEPGDASERLVSAWYDLARYACLLFTGPVVLLLGGPVIADAAEELRRGRPSLSLFLCVGVAAALVYSVWSLLSGGGHVYFEVASTILLAVTLGRWLEATGKLKTTAALRGLKALLPDQVRMLGAGGEELIDAKQLVVGDVIRVLPGERVAADGEIVRFQAAVDEQAITGESLPVIRAIGDRVISGTLVVDGPLEIRATATASEGTLARMIEAVAGATAARTRYERLAEGISHWFLPAVGVVAAISFGVHAWLGNPAGGLLAALAVLVISCPCALGLATPMALWAAIGRAAKAGVLVRDGDAFGSLATAKTVCFDKTGTLTTSEAIVDGLQWVKPTDERLVLSVAVALSRASNHPLAVAIDRYAGARISRCVAADHARVHPGQGVEGYSEDAGAATLLGSRAWMAERGQQLPLEAAAFCEPDHDVAAEALVAWDGRVRGRFVFRELVRPEAETTIALLRRLGMDCVMLTGDRVPRAKALAESLGVGCRAGLLPEDKLAAIRSIQFVGPVAMVGDGINDAPALAAADVGIALGGGTDISRHSAQVCLLADDLARLPWLVRLARQTQRTIRWNLVWAFAYNIMGIGLAAVGWLHPVVAAIAMGLSSLLVVSNSLDLGQFEPDVPPVEAG